MTAKLHVEDIEPAAGQVIGKASRRQMPRVTVLPEAVHQENGGSRALAIREALSHHREGHRPARDDDLLAEGRGLGAIDYLGDGASLEDHDVGSCAFAVRSPPVAVR